MKHLKVFLIASILIFSFLFIGSVKALTFKGVTIDQEFFDNGWNVLEGKTANDLTGNSYTGTIWNNPYYQEDFDYVYCSSSGSNFDCYFLPDYKYKSKDSMSVELSSTVLSKYAYAPGFKYSSSNKTFTPLYANSFYVYNASYYTWGTNFDVYNGDTKVISKKLDYTPVITPPSYTINFHLNGGWIYNSSIDFGSEEDFSLSLYQDEFIEFMNNSEVNKQSMVFDGWFYDDTFTQRFSINDTIDSDINLYAKFRFKVADDFLSDSNFNEYEFDENYLYGLINRGNNVKSVYIGLPFEVFDLEIYEYNESSYKVKDGASACPVPIIKKDGYYYYDINTLYTSDQEVLILPKSYFDNLSPNNYHFYLTDNAYIHYTNDLSESIIVDSSGNEVNVNFKNSYEISRQYHEIYSNKENSFAQLKVFLAQIKKTTSIFPKLAEYFYNSLNETIQNFLIYIFIIILIVTVFRIIRRS